MAAELALAFLAGAGAGAALTRWRCPACRLWRAAARVAVARLGEALQYLELLEGRLRDRAVKP